MMSVIGSHNYKSDGGWPVLSDSPAVTFPAAEHDRCDAVRMFVDSCTTMTLSFSQVLRECVLHVLYIVHYFITLLQYCVFFARLVNWLTMRRR